MTIDENIKRGIETFDVYYDSILNDRAFRRRMNKAGYKVEYKVNREYIEIFRVSKMKK